LLTDPFQPGDSPIHRLDPQLKLATLLAVIVATALLPSGSWRLFLGNALLFLLVLSFSGLSVWRLTRQFLVLEAPACGFALFALLHENGHILFFTLLCKSSLCLLWVLLMTATTPFSTILTAARRLKLPRLLVSTLTLAWRYLFVLSEEAERLERARRSRTLNAGTRLTWFLNTDVIGNLFVRTLFRAERVFAAMSARGWKR